MDKILKILWFLTVVATIVHSQTTLQYDIFEETELPLSIANLFSASNLRDAYSAEQVASMSLEIAEQESNLHEFFSITATGMLQVSSRLDRDSICRNARTCQINLDIQVQPFEFFQIIKVEVSIMDTNDNTPSFGDTNSQHVLAITEGPASDIPQSLPQATDPDSPTNSVVRYEISGERNNFELQTFTAVDGTIEPLLRVLVPLDRETTSQYSLILYAIDGGVPSQTGSVTIIVDVTDANDLYPVFDRQLYEETIDEDIALGTFVLGVLATDDDVGDNAAVTYSFAPQTEQDILDAFQIDPNSGSVTVKGSLDYETRKEYSITVVAKDGGQSPLSSQSRVIIHLRDVNDNPPIIALHGSTDTNQASVQENKPVSSFVAYIRVSDRDSNENGNFTCEMNNENFIFEKIHENDYTLVTNAVLDRESQSEHYAGIICRDGGTPAQTSLVNIEVLVTDENDSEPIFEQNMYLKTVVETNEVGQHLLTVKAVDNDVGDNAVVTYSFVDAHSPHMTSLYLDPISGNVTVVGPLDYEKEHQVDVTVVATDHGEPALSGTTALRIDIIDIDDERPLFVFENDLDTEYSFAVEEHSDNVSYVDTVLAVDADSDQFNFVTYFIKPMTSSTDEAASTVDDASLPFRIDEDTGAIYTTMSLNREVQDAYSFIAVAGGASESDWQTEVTVNVRVADKNDHTPQILFPNTNNNSVQLSSSVRQGALVTTIVATDDDIGDNARLQYFIEYDARGVAFAVDENTGKIIAARDFDTSYEVVVITIRVKDRGVDSRENTSFLNVVFTYSAASSSKNSDDSNETLVIIIAVLAGVIVTALTLAIICLLRRHKDAKAKGIRDYLKNCNEIMNAHNIVNDNVNLAPPVSKPVMMPTGLQGNSASLDTSYQSNMSAMPHHGLESLGHENRAMLYDSERGAYVVLSRTHAPSSSSQSNTQVARDDDADSACSLEGSTSDSGRGSHDDTAIPRLDSTSSENPPIPHRLPVNRSPRLDDAHHLRTRDLNPGLHAKHQTVNNLAVPNMRHLYTDNKKNYDERVFQHGAGSQQSRDVLPSYSSALAAYPGNNSRLHVPSPSPSLQHQPGHDPNPPHGIFRQRSLNIPDLPPRKSVHYCSQV